MWGLVLGWVGEDSSNRMIFDLLKACGIESEFIKTVDVNAKFKDIRKVLEEYDKWLSQQAM